MPDPATPSAAWYALVTETLAALLHLFENCRIEAYPDSGAVFTIGWGHTQGVKKGDTCTAAQADTWLAEDSKPLLSVFQDVPAVTAAAWSSFGYNCGKHAMELAIAGKVDMTQFIHDKHGNELDGLKKRRRLEISLIRASAAGYFEFVPLGKIAMPQNPTIAIPAKLFGGGAQNL